MTRRPNRMGRSLTRPYRQILAVLQILFAALIFAAPSGSTHQAPRIDPIEASNLAMLEELGAWVAEGSTDVRGVIRQRPLSFEVFRSYHEPSVRNSVLAHVPYGDLIQRAAERHGLDPLLVAAVVETESHYDPQVVSGRGAIGLMQILPSTADTDEQMLLEPAFNLEQGARYLRYLLERYEGDLELTLAAYNAGPSNVRRYGGVPPFRETRLYVEKVLERYFTHHQDVWQTSKSGELLASAHQEAVARRLDSAAG